MSWFNLNAGRKRTTKSKGVRAPRRLAFESLEGRELLSASPGPTAPSSLAATIQSASQVQLTWSASAHETGYIAYDSVNNSAWKEIGRPGANQTSLVASGLSPGAYRFIVVAYNNNASALSQTVSATLVAPPIAPTLATPHVASSSEIDLSWSGGSGASNYQIYCSAPGTSWSNTHVVSSSVHQYSITNLSPGFTYSFRVVATTSIAASPSSNSVLATTLPGSANLAGPAVKSSTEIDLSWSPATGAAGYQVMEQGPNGMWGYAGGQLTAGKTSLNVTSLTPGTSYSFIVRAVNSSGGFTSSQTVTATTDIRLTNVPFVYQGTGNYLCEFASAAMLASQQFGKTYTMTDAVKMANLATRSAGDAGPGWTVEDARTGVDAYLHTTATTAGTVPYSTVIQELKIGHAVSVGVWYGDLGSPFSSNYTAGHQIVVIGYSAANHTWTYLDPLDKSGQAHTVSDAVFERAADDLSGGQVVKALYFN
jgi:hypothetical protein